MDSISNEILTGTVITQNISRLDIFIDQRPVQSVDISDVTTQVIIKLPNGASSLELQGFDNNQLVAACKTKIQSIEKLEV